MNARTRYGIAIGLIAAGIAGLVLMSIVPPSELAKRGVQTHGEVLFKDSRPAADGSFTYTVTFVYPDATQRNHQVTRIVLNNGRIITGLVKQEFDKVLLVQTPTEEVRLQKSDIESRQRQRESLMPEGLLTPLKDREVRDLIAYLAGDGQVPLPR